MQIGFVISLTNTFKMSIINNVLFDIFLLLRFLTGTDLAMLKLTPNTSKTLLKPAGIVSPLKRKKNGGSSLCLPEIDLLTAIDALRKPRFLSCQWAPSSSRETPARGHGLSVDGDIAQALAGKKIEGCPGVILPTLSSGSTRSSRFPGTICLPERTPDICSAGGGAARPRFENFVLLTAHGGNFGPSGPFVPPTACTPGAGDQCDYYRGTSSKTYMPLFENPWAWTSRREFETR